MWCVLVCYNTGYRVGKLKGLPSRRKGIMNMARYHYTRENENGVVLYLESEPAEDAMDEFDDEIAVGFSGNGYLSFWTRCRRAAEALPNGVKYAAGGRCVITDDLESRIDNAEEYTVPRKTAVQCLETGKMYESIADASRDTGINQNSIRAVARGDRHKAGGYTWEYVNPAPDKRDNRGCNQPTAKKVRCAETGNQFVSLGDAARAVGLRNGNSIRRAIDRGGTAGGYHWEYLDEKKEVSTDDHHQADGRAE